MATATAVAQLDDAKPLDVDKHLRPLLSPLGDAVNGRSCVAVLSLWTPIRVSGLLPAHLHLRWPGEVKDLPLTPYFAIMPFQGADWDLSAESIYSVSESQLARQSARISRTAGNTLLTGDLRHPDWEQVAGRFRGSLPAQSYLSFDRLLPSGDIKRGRRRVVGNRVPRGELRPTILVPAELSLEKPAYEELRKCHAVIINAQNVRGRRTARFLASAIEALRGTVPLFVLAASPADLAYVGFNVRPDSSDRLVVLTDHVLSIGAKAFPVGQGRISAERELSFSLEGIEERSEELATLIVLARRAWWAARQMLSPSVPHEVIKFQRLLENRRIGELQDIALLNDCARLIQRETDNVSAHEERRGTVIQAALNDGQAKSVLVIAKPGAVKDIKRELSEVMGVSEAELATLGVHVQSAFDILPLSDYDTCVSAGYFGPATIDLALASRATRIHFVVDPIEARIAIWDLQTRFRQYSAWLPQSVQKAIAALIDVLTQHAVREADTVSLASLEDFRQSAFVATKSVRENVVHEPDQVLIDFSDGSSMEVQSQTRFAVLGKSALRLQSAAARDLKPGDQVVIVEQDSRDAFSETVFRAVDEGRYKKQSSTRQMWLTLVNRMCAEKGLTPTKLSRLLRQRGFDVDVTTVRGWIKSPSAEGASVPERLDWFRALCESIELAVPKEILDGWFKDIRQLRVAHRNVGRDLARAIRGAYLGQLAAPTLQRIERDWGVKTRELITAARVATVDEVTIAAIGGSDVVE
jgi:hypothetical protein